eukprot:955785-Alexandrium_andersonii.AAC.1
MSASLVGSEMCIRDSFSLVRSRSIAQPALPNSLPSPQIGVDVLLVAQKNGGPGALGSLVPQVPGPV